MPSAWLMVIDLEGALFAPDGAIHERDRLAIDGARALGVEIAFATSRRALAAGERLRIMGLRGWVIGSDGAEITAVDGKPLTRHVLPSTVAARAAAMMRQLELRVVALTSAGAHGDPDDAPVVAEALGPVADAYVASIPQLRDVCGLAGIGHAGAIARAKELLTTEAPNRMTASSFTVGAHHVVRARALRATRTHAIGEVCARLGIRRTRATYVGGPLHPSGDPSALGGCGRAFLTPGATQDTQRRVEVLSRGPGEGAIVEALERWRTSRSDASVS